MSWDVEWAAEKASAALRYLADFYSECAASEALHPLHDAAPTRRPSPATGKRTLRRSGAT